MNHYAKLLSPECARVIAVINDTLKMIDPRLVDHGERVAYLSNRMLTYSDLQDRVDPKILFLLSVFHDIGAYKTDEIDRMTEFETNDVQNHSIYGYLFLKHITELGDRAKAILYHHANYSDLDMTQEYAPYAALISLADRIDILLLRSADVSASLSRVSERFSPSLLTAYEQLQANEKINECILDHTYQEKYLAVVNGKIKYTLFSQ